MMRIPTKYGYKARRVTPSQESAMDKIAADRFADPISRVDILNENFHEMAVVHVSNGEVDIPTYLIARDGSVAPLR